MRERKGGGGGGEGNLDGLDRHDVSSTDRRR